MPFIRCPHCAVKIRFKSARSLDRFVCPKCKKPLAKPIEKDWREAPPQSVATLLSESGPNDAEPLAAPVLTSEQPSDEVDEIVADYGRNWEKIVVWAGAALVLVALAAAVVFVVIRESNKVVDGSRQSTATTAKTQKDNKQAATTESAQADQVTGAGALLCILVLPIAYVMFVLYIMAWVARDAYRRGMEGGMWAFNYICFQFVFGVPFILSVISVLVSALGTVLSPILGVFLLGALGSFFAALLFLPLSWAGLCVYLVARRRGQMAVCSHCGNDRLGYMLRCPHCDHDQRRSAE